MDARSERIEARFQRPIIVATLLVIPVMILQGIAPGEPWNTIGYIGDWAIWLVFAAEVVVMLAVVPDRRAWARSHVLDILIVVVTPPLTPDVLASFRLLRVLRLVRLFRVAQLARGAFTIEGLRYAAFLAVLTLVAGAAAFAVGEHEPFDDGLYWAIGTMTTAGSGKIEATTNEIQAVGSVLMVVGLAFAAILTGAIAQRFIVTEDTVTAGNLETMEKQDQTHAKLDALGERMDRLEAAINNLSSR